MLKAKCERFNRGLLVLDVNLDPDWQADFITDDQEKFLAVVKANTSCEVVVDEAGESVGRYAKEMKFLATRSRQFGHVATFISQGAKDIDKIIRNQCTTLFLFNVYHDDAEIMAKTWVDPILMDAPYLKQGEYFGKERYKDAIKLNSFEQFK